MNFWSNKNVLITGGHGFAGHAVMANLEAKNPKSIIAPQKAKIDLRKEEQVKYLFNKHTFDIVIHLAGKVGGIKVNKEKTGEFYYDNIMMGTLVLEYARKSGVDKLVALAAGCGYPKYLDTPYNESNFWAGFPDENSYGYSMAKKMLVIQSWAYREQYGFDSTILLPANLYGPHDNFDLNNSHVVPALIRKFVEAKLNNKDKVIVWGSGKAKREFLYVEDTAKVILDSVEKITETGPFNLGTGIETSIKDLVEEIKVQTKYTGKIVWDASKPDGQPRRYYEMSRLLNALGYIPTTNLKDGIRQTIEWYKKNRKRIIQ